MNLSTKELALLKDALGQEQQIITKCHDFAQKVEAPELKDFLNQLADGHQQDFDKLYQQLN